MIGRQAKVLTPGDLRRLVSLTRKGRFPERDRVMVLLAVRAGLRAREIAKLSWGMVLDANGRIASMIEVRDSIAKRGSGRRVPMHPELNKALLELWHCQSANSTQPDAEIVRSLKGGGLRANSVVNWFITLCRAAKLQGCKCWPVTAPSKPPKATSTATPTLNAASCTSFDPFRNIP